MTALKTTLLLFVAAVAACGNPDEERDGAAQLGIELDTRAVRLVDTSNASTISKVVVWIDSVTVHSAKSGWTTLRDRPFTFDLLASRTRPVAIASATLPADVVTQIRLITSPTTPGYVVTMDGVTHPLVVPSGEQTGIKIDGSWNLGACQMLTLVLAVPRAFLELHPTGGGDSWILNPELHVSGQQLDDLVGCIPRAPSLKL